jgi:lipopolysaccharide export LptBFGC system permease protein LptF
MSESLVIQALGFDLRRLVSLTTELTALACLYVAVNGSKLRLQSGQ